MKTHWQNQLKISVLVWFKILYRIRYKKIDVALVQCPFKCVYMFIKMLFKNWNLLIRLENKFITWEASTQPFPDLCIFVYK